MLHRLLETGVDTFIDLQDTAFLHTYFTYKLTKGNRRDYLCTGVVRRLPDRRRRVPSYLDQALDLTNGTQLASRPGHSRKFVSKLAVGRRDAQLRAAQVEQSGCGLA